MCRNSLEGNFIIYCQSEEYSQRRKLYKFSREILCMYYLNFLFQFQKYLHLNYHRMLMLKLVNLYRTLLKQMTPPGHRMPREELRIAGKLHITIYGRISLVPTLTLMWSNGLAGGHLQLVDSYRHVHYTSEIYLNKTI